MDRLAELAGYAQSFPGMVDEDFIAAGFTPEEVSSYRSQTDPQPMTPEEISLMADRFGTLQEPDYTLRERAVQSSQDILSNTFGMNPYSAGVLSRNVLGDPNSSRNYGMGLADFTPLGAVFATQEGSRTASSGYEAGDPVEMGLGAFEVLLGVAEGIPIAGRAVRPLSKAVINTVEEVFDSPFGAEVIGHLRAIRDLDVDFLRGRGDPALAQGVGADVPGRPPLTFDEVEAAMKAEAPATVPARAKSPEPPPQGIKAYQGSPHDFAAERLVRYPDGSTEYIVGSPDVLPDIPAGAEVLEDFPLGRMRMDKIGTGEGAQAYGHGIYSAEAEGVAQKYRDDLTANISVNNAPIIKNGQIVGSTGDEELDDLIMAARGDIDVAIAEAHTWLQEGIDSGNPRIIAGAQQEIDKLQSVKSVAVSNSPGSMYEININADPADFLDYDASLSNQTGKAAEYISNYEMLTGQPILPLLPQKTNTGKDLMLEIGGKKLQAGAKNPSAEISDYLRAEGIPGIKYLDAGSRGTSDATRNFVVFDEKLISIVKKYGIAGAATMLGVSALDVEQALADNLAPSDWEDLVAGPVVETVSSIKEKYPLFSDIEVRDLRDQGVQDGRRLEFTEAYDDRVDSPLIEIFDPDLQGDELEQAIIGEFLHEAPRRIPEYAKLREKLQKLKTPQQLQDDMNSYLYDVENYGENRPFEKWDEVSRKDAFIRGHAVGQWEPEYYTDEQKTLIDEMMGLIRSGANK